MNTNYSKIKIANRERQAYVYVRQSSLRQVEEHKEGRLRQYQLVDWAVAAGWSRERVIVIDSDQGKSSANPDIREGFAQLISAVGRGEAGIVIALEASRLARNSPDWHHLIYMCRWTNTLIADENSIYDPGDSSDRMILGIRGQMSEMELDNSIHRMIEARWNKAKRGELMTSVPAGYDFDDTHQIILTADDAIRQAVYTVFEKIEEFGAARRVYAWWKENGLKFPVRRCQLRSKPIVWVNPNYSTILRVLKNPVYAGVYAFGRIKTVRNVDGEDSGRLKMKRIRQKEWPVLIKEHHSGYISFEKYVEIQDRMSGNSMMHNKAAEGETGAVREGPALLQGLVRCSKCGRSLNVSYGGNRSGRQCKVYQYRCFAARRLGADRDCQVIGGKRIDACVVKAFLEVATPAGVAAAQQASEQKRIQQESLQQYWKLQVEKAEYEAQRSYRQYQAVEPENRLVARELEHRWNEKLSEVEKIRSSAKIAFNQATLLTEQELDLIKSLSTDLVQAWNSNTTTDRDRKRLLRCLIEEVQLNSKSEGYLVRIIWKGGATTERKVDRIAAGKTTATSDDIIELVRTLATEFDDAQIARILNRQGRVTGLGNPFTQENILSLRGRNRIPVMIKKLIIDPKVGPFTADQAAKELDVALVTIHRWLREGILIGEQMTPAAPWRIRLTEETRRRLAGGDAPPSWVGLTEAARRLGISKAQAAHLVNNGKLNAVRVQVGKRKCWRIEANTITCEDQSNLFNQMITQ